MIRRIALILLISFVSGCSDDAKLQALNDDAILLAFGDSLTYGTGTSPDHAYPAKLASLINRRVINAGIPGEISKNGLMRLPALLEQHHPDLIIICHGGNDILRKLDIRQTKSNLQQMINLARANNTQVLLIGVPEFGLFLNNSPIYRALAEENQIPLEDGILSDILGKNTLKSDHIHPNTQGYQLFAERIFALLKQSGAIVNQ